MAVKSFETLIIELEEIVSKMEKGDVPLDKAIELYEKGTKISKKCSEMLDKAEQKITFIENSDDK